jgi:hypothetical protein
MRTERNVVEPPRWNGIGRLLLLLLLSVSALLPERAAAQ